MEAQGIRLWALGADSRLLRVEMRNSSLPLLAAPGIEAQLQGDRCIPVGARGRQLHHSRHITLAENWLAEHIVVHVPSSGDEPGILDIAHDLGFIHAVSGTGGADDV